MRVAVDAVIPESGGTYSDGNFFPHRNWWTSKGLGVYKNIAYGYSGTLQINDIDTVEPKPLYWKQSTSMWPMSFPTSWISTGMAVHTASLPGNDTLVAVKIFPLTSAYTSINPDLGFYVVALAVKAWPNLEGYWGIWEIVPEHAYPDSSGLLDLFTDVITNLEVAGELDPWEEPFYPVWLDLDSSSYTNWVGEIDYISVMTGERVSFALGYGASPWESGVGLGGRNAVRRINGNADSAHKYHGNIDSPGSLPLIEVHQVDSNYNFTDIYYVSGDSAGKITVNNPYMEWKIELDASDWWNPKREETINRYIIHANAFPENPGEFSSWEEAYATVRDKMAELEAYDGSIKFIYVSPGKAPVLPATGVYEAFPLDGVGDVPFTLEGRTDFPE